MRPVLSNAIKFTPENGNIYLFTELTELEHQPTLMLRMKDTGIGIGPEQLPHIFDRFYQADNSTTRKGEGTGIGLALTLELVKLMSGTINVKSVPKKGTDFTIILPITKEAPVKQEENIHEPEEDIPLDINTTAEEAVGKVHRNTVSSSDKPVALVVEDNNDVIDYLSKSQKYQRNHHCNNGLEGIEKATTFLPDIIISDVMMPEKNGYELCATDQKMMCKPATFPLSC